MAGKKDKEYLIDVAKRHKYRNQSEKYQEMYLQWRTDPRNPYGYTFVHDTRVHAYVDGEGYLEETPISNERTALRNCGKLMAAALLIMVLVAFVRYIVMELVFGIPYSGRSYHSSRSYSLSALTDGAAYTLLALNVLEYLLPIVYLKAASRMPSKIAVPFRQSRNISTVNAVLMMLVIMSIGRFYNNILARLLEGVKIDIPYYDYINTSGTVSQLMCGLVQHVVIAVLIEVIFRGYLLQMLRQFGDNFAVIITSVAGCLMLYDITQIGYMFCVGIFMGVVTIRSGSIKNACIMRVIARYTNYLLTLISGFVGAYWADVIDLAVMGGILICALIVYARINSRRRWSFEVSSASTSVPMAEKFRVVLLSPIFWIWLVAAMAMSVLLMRIM